MAGSGDGCRSELASLRGSDRWVTPVAVALFVTGFWTTSAFIRSVPAAARLDGVAEFDLWTGVLGALGGFAGAACVYLCVWLAGIIRLGTRVRPATAWSWVALVLVVLAMLFASLFAAGTGADESVDKDLAVQARPIPLLLGLCLAPGLVAFLALRFVATEDASWQESGSCRLRLVIRLRAELRRLLATFGAFLTLLVVVTGLRRRALLAFDPALAIPPEQVLLYGLVFAVLLGLFFAIATGALDARAARLLDEFAPVPDPTGPDLSDRLRRRSDLAALIGAGGSWRSFETTVVIAAPLLTALIGVATGD